MFGCVIATTDWQLSSWETIRFPGVLGQGAIQFSLKHNYHFLVFCSNSQVLRQQHNNFILLCPSACFRTGISSLQPLLPLPFIWFLHFRQPFSFWEAHRSIIYEKRGRELRSGQCSSIQLMGDLIWKPTTATKVRIKRKVTVTDISIWAYADFDAYIRVNPYSLRIVNFY